MPIAPRQHAVQGSAPRVSVVVTCFNLGAHLDEAVDSLLAQTFPEVEILIVDDGSTDSTTRRLLASYDRPRTRVLSSEHRGLPAARNLGIAHTTGEYLCLFDADDRADPELIGKSVAALDADPSIAFVSHWLRTFGDEHADWTPTDCTFPALLDMNTVNGAALVRRQAVEAVGGFDESFTDGCEDWDFWITLVERGYAGRILPEVLFHYRRHASSMSRAMAREGRHPELYRRLVAKHAETWRAHLPTLLARRERDIGALQREIHKIDIDQHDVIDPQVQGLRDDLRAAERARERRAEAARSECVEREHQRLTGEVARLQGEVSRLASECARLGEDAARRVDDQARATQEIARRAAEVEALRESWSWRLTAPLRALLDAWLRFRRTR